MDFVPLEKRNRLESFIDDVINHNTVYASQKDMVIFETYQSIDLEMVFIAQTVMMGKNMISVITMEILIRTEPYHTLVILCDRTDRKGFTTWYDHNVIQGRDSRCQGGKRNDTDER